MTPTDYDFNKLGYKLAEHNNTNWYTAMSEIDAARKLYGDELAVEVIANLLSGMSWINAVHVAKYEAAQHAEYAEWHASQDRINQANEYRPLYGEK